MLCRQLLQLSGTPLIASLEDFRVTIEIEEARARERWRSQHEVERTYRKLIWILVQT